MIEGDDGVIEAGANLASARAALVLVHGRGATARGMLGLARQVAGSGVAWLAPQAEGNAWYPHSFLEPLERNEPHLSAGLSLLDDVCRRTDEEGPGLERTVLLGFSQGGCLALEFAARNARRYGGVVGLSAGLIGPEGTPRDYDGDLAGTPVFLGCSDVDPHIPLERVRETAAVFRDLGARVDERIYPDLGHTVNREEIASVTDLIAGVSG